VILNIFIALIAVAAISGVLLGIALPVIKAACWLYDSLGHIVWAIIKVLLVLATGASLMYAIIFAALPTIACAVVLMLGLQIRRVFA
jgi:hypothetical protein